MSDERTAEPAPGTPGQRALGAMESAVRTPPVSRREPLPCLLLPTRGAACDEACRRRAGRGEAAAGSARADTTTRSARCNAAAGSP